VRVGPNELSFNSAGAVKYLHGPQGARLTKGPYYDTHVFSTGGKSMPGTRDWEDHRIRRRIWDHGFSQKSLKSYEPRLLGLLDVLCNELERLEGSNALPVYSSLLTFIGQSVDFAAWCDYFAFDAMGDLAFNTSFGLMTAGASTTRLH
jgi:cytochrome P450